MFAEDLLLLSLGFGFYQGRRGAVKDAFPYGGFGCGLASFWYVFFCLGGVVGCVLHVATVRRGGC